MRDRSNERGGHALGQQGQGWGRHEAVGRLWGGCGEGEGYVAMRVYSPLTLRQVDTPNAIAPVDTLAVVEVIAREQVVHQRQRWPSLRTHHHASSAHVCATRHAATCTAGAPLWARGLTRLTQPNPCGVLAPSPGTLPCRAVRTGLPSAPRRCSVACEGAAAVLGIPFAGVEGIGHRLGALTHHYWAYGSSEDCVDHSERIHRCGHLSRVSDRSPRGLS